MFKKITYIFIICLCLAADSFVFSLAPKSHPLNSLSVENEVVKFSDLVMEMSKQSVILNSSITNDRMKERLRRQFIPQLTEILASWNLKIAQDKSGRFFPLKFNSLQASARQDYQGVMQNKITFQVTDKGGEIYSVVYSPQNTKRSPFLNTPEMMANYISVFDKDNRKVSLRKFLYCQKDNLPLEAKIPELRGDTQPVLTVPAFIVSRIGGEDGVSLEAINRIKILLRKAERLEKEGKIAPGYRLHIITGDYEKNPYLEELVKRGRLKICNIPSADPDKKIESNQKLFYAMFGINSEAEKQEFVREIQERSDKVVLLQEKINSLDRNIKKVITRDNLKNKKKLLDFLYAERSEKVQELIKLQKVLNEKKIYYQKKGKKNKNAALKSLNKQAEKIYQTMSTYLAENNDIETTILENASLPFFQAKLFKAAFQLIKENNFSTIIINHDWPDDRTEIYDFDSVLEEIQEVFLKEFFPHYPNLSYASINERDKNKYYKKRDIAKVTNIGNVFDAETAHEEFTRGEELRKLLLGEEHKDDFVVLLPVRPVGRKRIDAALIKLGMLKREREVHGKDANLTVVVSHSEKDAHPEEELEPLKKLAEVLGVNLVFGAEPINKFNEMNKNNQFELFDQYYIADFVDYSSDFEGFGNALLETIFFKVPVVCNRYEVLEQDILPKKFPIPTYKINPTFKFKDFVSFLTVNKELPNEDLKNKLYNLYLQNMDGTLETVKWIDDYIDAKETFISSHPDINRGIPGESLPEKYREMVEKSFDLLLKNYSFKSGEEHLNKMLNDAIGSNNIENVYDDDPSFLILDPVQDQEYLTKSA